jgi:surface protein
MGIVRGVSGGEATAASLFYLAPNGVTVKCENAAVGDTGEVGGVTYTKRTAEEIEADNSLAATSCTSGIAEMNSIFHDASTFNQDIGHWNTSSVRSMDYMFSSASAFNHDIGNWNTSSVGTMTGMFYLASAFNQDLSGWTVGSVRSYNIFDALAYSWEESNKPNFS